MPIFDDDHVQIGEVVVRYDITQKKRYEEMAITDPLTQIYNRRYFNEIIDNEINKATKNKSILSFMILDVDYFKKYNDTYGHIAGDNTLIAISNTLKEATEEYCGYPFRLGGEEFGVIYTACSDADATDFAQKIKNDIANLNIPHSSSDVTDHVTASVGLITIDFRVQTADKDEFYRLADSALYSAKENGRDQVYLHNNNEIELF